MRQTTLICVLSTLTLLASGAYAEDSLNEPIGPLVPVHFFASANTTSTTYYPAVTTPESSPVKVAGFAPSYRDVPAVYVADADEAEAAEIFASALTPAPALTPSPEITPVPETTFYRPVAPAVYNGTTVLSPASPACRTPVSPYCPPTTTPVRMVSYRPVVETSPMPRDYYVGRGMIGQPVVYVPNQPVRNALRWFFP
jgi:hypothetical protein